MVPSLGGRVFRLQAPILNGEQIFEDSLLVHGLAEQSTTVTGTGAQLLTCGLHGLVLALELKFLLAALLRLEQLPGTVDGPVAEVAVTGEAERTGGERMVEEVADKSCIGMLAIEVFRVSVSCVFENCRRVLRWRLIGVSGVRVGQEHTDSLIGTAGPLPLG